MNDDPMNSGVGIERPSLVRSLADRYNSWNSREHDRGPSAPGVDFLNNDYVEGFTPNAVMGASDIRDIGRGGSGGTFKYGNENRIPKETSDAITMTFRAGDANSIQKEFQSRPITGQSRFTSKGLNYIDNIPGFNNVKYGVNFPNG